MAGNKIKNVTIAKIYLKKGNKITCVKSLQAQL